MTRFHDPLFELSFGHLKHHHSCVTVTGQLLKVQEAAFCPLAPFLLLLQILSLLQAGITVEPPLGSPSYPPGNIPLSHL